MLPQLARVTLCLGAVLAAGCAARPPSLLPEFRDALSREFEVEDSDLESGDGDRPHPAYDFMKRHGRAGLDAYRWVVGESLYAVPGDGVRFTALRVGLVGLMDHGDRADEALLEKAATDGRVALEATLMVLEELGRRHPERRSELFGRRLLALGRGGAPKWKLLLVASLAQQLDPEARKWLERALENEPTPEVRRALEAALAP